eukprot:TRINITY_DN60713_c0_g1_i1.p1 TRINITY_DN60713_c0_g1~~TRINITY_DN60713_c0_g1_i1.p1  ORF type:complete len:875 (+),score=127.00 TRINITY_DN60713_c0_g1_i1:56-2626(+)
MVELGAARLPTFLSACQAHAQATWVVEGAGDSRVDGIYARTGQSSEGCDVFRKHGSSFAVLRHGASGWALADMGGSGTDRWSLYTVELYRTVQIPAGFSPPEFGWVPVDASPPGPFLRRATPQECELLVFKTPQKVAKPKQKTDLLRRDVSESRPLSRSKSQPVMPADPKERRQFNHAVTALGLPDLSTQPKLLPEPGYPIDQVEVFRVMLWRPNALTTWGFIWSDSPFQETGARNLASVESGSPLAKWNIWQRVRGRLELCVQRGDRLLRVDGLWAFYDAEVGTQDGDMGALAVETSSTGAIETAGCITLEFARMVSRPAPLLDVPIVEARKDDPLLSVFWATYDNPPPENVTGWAVCVKDLESNLWYSVDGSTGVADSLYPGVEVGAFPPDVYSVRVKGLVTGRRYYAVVAFLTKYGWSTFSEPSQPVRLPNRTIVDELMTGMGREPIGEEWPERPRFCVPTQFVPGFSSPVSLRLGPRDLCSAPRRLRLRTELVGGAVGLHLHAVLQGQALQVTAIARDSPVARWFEEQTRTKAIQLHGHTVVPALRPNDIIVTVNGIAGDAARMQAELRREPESLVLTFDRAEGNSSMPTCEPRNLKIDSSMEQMMAQVAEEVNWHVLMEAEEGALAFGLVSMDGGTLEKLMRPAAYAAQWAPRLVAGRIADLMQEVEKRLPILRQRRGAASIVVGEASNVALGLKLAFCDTAANHELLAGMMQRFKATTKAVVASKIGQVLLQRASSLHILWEWRQLAIDNRKELLAIVREALRSEVSTGEGDTEDCGDTGGGPPTGNSSSRVSSPTSVTRFEIEQLVEAIEVAEPYRCIMELDLAECRNILQRIKLGNSRKKRLRPFSRS